MKKKLLALLLVFAMVSVLGIPAFAISPASEIEDAEVELFYRDPFITDKEIAAIEDQSTQVSSVQEPIKNWATAYTSIADAGAYLRQQMKNRVTSISLQYRFSFTASSSTISSYGDQIYTNAISETGNGDEGDYIFGQIRYSYAPTISTTTSGLYKYATYTYSLSYQSDAAMETAVTNAVNTLLNSFNFGSGTSDYQKFRAIYDYICTNVVYGYGASGTSGHSAYNALIEHSAVCQGYATLFYRLAMESGLKARVVFGHSTLKNENHAWNIVRINGTWYNVDATWDSQISQSGGDYDFCLRGSNNFPYHVAGKLVSGDAISVPEELSSVSTTDFKMTPLRIVTQPKNQQGKVDDIVTFSIVAEGDDLSYTWYMYEPQDPTKLHEINTNPSWDTLLYDVFDGLCFYCVVTDGYGNSVQSNTVTITIIPDETEVAITSQPSDITVADGNIATFKVVASGTNLTYQWQYKMPSGSWKNCTSKTTGYNAATLKVDATGTRNGYQYRCIVTDGNGNSITSNAATLTVQGGLAITSQPKNVSVTGGSIASFSISATGSKLSYQWQYKMPSGSWKNCTSKTTGYNAATLKVEATVARNGYQYRCIVTDGSGKSVNSNAATLTVTGSLAITSQPVNATVDVGETVKFTVKATGTNLSYQWQYYTSANGVWKNSGMTGSSTATISVPATEARNGQKYRCIVTDPFGGKATSSAAVLTVTKTELAITQHPTSQTVSAGDTAVFTVKAQGSGLTYQWQYKTTSSTTWKDSGMTGATTNTLKVPATAARNGQKYRCIVTDASTESLISKSATLNVK